MGRSLKYVKKILNIKLLFIEFLIAFVSGYFLLMLLGASVPVGNYQPEEKGIEIYMKSDGIHTDFVFPVFSSEQDWSAVFRRSQTRGNDSTRHYISIGWGDQGFFLNTPEWSDLTFKTAFNAVFYRSRTAVHINYMHKSEFPEKVVRMKISRSCYRKLCGYVKSSLRKKQGKLDWIANRGYWESDSFYQATGSYGMFHTCNSWINEGLKSAGLRACLWTPFNQGIFSKYR